VKTPISTPGGTPLAGSLTVGLGASLCCGGGLLFGSIGLGALYGGLQMSRYIPQALAIGAILIALLNWLYYRRKAARLLAAKSTCDCGGVRRAMLLSALLGLVMMTVSFVFLEWLNHAVVNATRFMGHHQYGGAIIPGVPNSRLGYLAMTLLVLPILAILPLPQRNEAAGDRETAAPRDPNWSRTISS
jgi:ascorbate-specific PTS system EIIC-type component UlaA